MSYHCFKIFRMCASRCIRPLSTRIATHYDILDLPRNCSSQDIREAFIKLSKKFHPDATGAKPSAAQFVKITEAYQVLSKPQLRNKYDQDLLARDRMAPGETMTTGGLHTTEFHRPWEIKPDYNTNPGAYYGIKGINKVSNLRIVLLLVGLSIFGTVFGFVSANHSFRNNRRKLDERNAEAALQYQAIRDEAKKYSNEEQVQRMLERLSRSPN